MLPSLIFNQDNKIAEGLNTNGPQDHNMAQPGLNQFMPGAFGVHAADVHAIRRRLRRWHWKFWMWKTTQLPGPKSWCDFWIMRGKSEPKCCLPWRGWESALAPEIVIEKTQLVAASTSEVWRSSTAPSLYASSFFGVISGTTCPLWNILLNTRQRSMMLTHSLYSVLLSHHFVYLRHIFYSNLGCNSFSFRSSSSIYFINKMENNISTITK